ncbi:MAG: enoyl-CoA hydratase-related protein [Gammaproteobacteria bacterium]|nr:enoyl-CoA hydratase-related protein [Gammaproteobacteria bacterium]
MSNDVVVLNVENGVASVTLNRGAVHNAFDEVMITQLSAVFDEVSGRDDIVALVLRGAGKSFSAGADLNWMKRAATFSQEQNKADALALAGMLGMLNRLPKLTIACVQGAAMGGGMGLICCCDIVIADNTAKFALSEVKLGLIPATVSPYVLAAIGVRQARRYFQTGERFGVKQAHKIGLVHIAVEDQDDMSEQLQGILKEVKSNGPMAMASAKALCLDFAGQSINAELINESASRIAATRAGEEAKEGLMAFLEKRKAKF